MQERDPDDEEHDLIIQTRTLEEFERMIVDGTIRDASTIAAWGLYLSWQKQRQTRTRKRGNRFRHRALIESLSASHTEDAVGIL